MRKLLFIFILTQQSFASFIKIKASYYDKTPFFTFSLSNPIVKEKRENPEICLLLGVCQRKDDFGVLMGGELKRSFLQYEGFFSPSYIFTKKDDIACLELLITEAKTPKISLLYSAFLEARKKETYFTIGPGLSYEMSPSLTISTSFQFGHSLRYGLELKYK